MKVEIGGVVCDVTASNAKEISCTTNARGHSLLADIVVTVAGKGQALSDAQFYYIGKCSIRLEICLDEI